MDQSGFMRGAGCSGAVESWRMLAATVAGSAVLPGSGHVGDDAVGAESELAVAGAAGAACSLEMKD